MKISMTAAKRLNPVGIGNANGRRNRERNGGKETENRLDLILSTEEEFVNEREKLGVHVPAQKLSLFVNNVAHEHVY